MSFDDIEEGCRNNLTIQELRLSGCEIAAGDAATTASMAGQLRLLRLVQ